jgi:serine/threonine protein kinase/tetratricopeptide (TPR) repeat protein
VGQVWTGDPVTAPPEQLAAALAGRYVIERELGQGGMAVVYLARDVRHDRRVALKVLRPELGAVLGAERFLAEIRVTANLQHPHVVPLFDSGEAAGLLYYVMPFVEGESLRDRLTRERQIPIEDAVQITRDVADALAYAHSLGVVHRDIKPENVLLAGGHALVADFGIARAVSAAGGQRITATGLAVGTPAYMSPEQATADSQLDGRSDIYSLASMLYEMLAGEPPYTAPTAQAMLARRLTDPMPSLRAVRETVPAHIEDAVRHALARSPADRFATAGAFAEALSRPAAGPPKPRSVAVLPFANLSADPENEYFADGITEDVIAQLSKIRALDVISRTSVMPFKGRRQGLREIAAQLQVATVLEGSVRRAGDRVRIVAQLIDAGTDQHLWTETYDRQLTDIFAIQMEVALHIAAALKAELSPDERARIRREPTSDVRAYQLYLQGRAAYIRFTGDGMRQAIRFFEQAIERDPGYALAYAGVATAFTELGEVGELSPGEAHPRAQAAAARAVALDPELGEAHCTVAYGKFVYEFDWAGAEQEFKRALELSPGNADTYDFYGRLCMTLERYDEAIAMLQRAQQLDPLAHRVDVATALLRAGRHAEALEAASRAVAFDRDDARGHSTLGWVYFRMGRLEEGLAALERAVAVAPGNTTWLAQLGEACALAGKRDRAKEILAELERQSQKRYVSPYHLAYVYTGLGQHDRAMDCLEQAFEQRAGAVYGIRGSFLFEPLRSHPRFQALLRRMHLA